MVDIWDSLVEGRRQDEIIALSPLTIGRHEKWRDF